MILKPGTETTLVISDTQSPFHHKDSIRFLAHLKKKHKPTYVVHIGDEVDMHALSDYDADPDGYSAGHELKEAMKFMRLLYKLFPNVLVVTSNHTARPLKRAFKAGIPQAYIKDYSEFLEAPPGWEWADSYVIDGILYEHGEGIPTGTTGAKRCLERNGRSTVHGHLHSGAGVNWYATKEQLHFVMNVGCLIDNNAYAFKYGKHAINKPVIGAGVVINGLPSFEPMLLNKRGRWIGV
jgi:hypothetical protein